MKSENVIVSLPWNSRIIRLPQSSRRTMTTLPTHAGNLLEPLTFISPFLNKGKSQSRLETSSKHTIANWSSLHDDITIVTMYIDIGKFQKGSETLVYTPEMYKNWMQAFRHLKNPIVAFFDNYMHADRFRRTRWKYINSTRIILLKDRNDLWTFRLIPKVKELFGSLGYPKHYPNTVVPEYSCATNAKYEVMQWAAQQNVFNTRYLAWVDMGYFRDLVPHLRENVSYHLYPPPDFNPNYVAYGRITNRNPTSTPKAIVSHNMHWVCGGFFIGLPLTLEQWSWQYHETTKRMLEENIISTDQQVRM